MKEETLDKIDRYLRGEMAEDEKKIFERVLAGDTSLRQRVELMKDITDSVEARAMKAHLMILENEHSKRKRVYRVRLMSSVLVAACLLLTVFVLRLGNEEPVISISIPSDFTHERGGNCIGDVVDFLRTDQYDKALSLIDSLEIEYKSEDSLLLAKKCLTEEEIYVRQSDSVALYQLGWLRIQALIGKKKLDEVRRLLKQYKLQEGVYRTKADSLWILLE